MAAPDGLTRDRGHRRACGPDRRERERRRRALVLAGLLGLAAVPVTAPANDGLTIDARSVGAAVQVDVRSRVRASHETVWNTLTDYDRLAEWIPGMRSSRVVERRADGIVVEQTGDARLWWFRYPIHVVVQSRESPPGAIDVVLVRGNLRRLEGGYRVAPPDDTGLIELRWVGLIEPDDTLPRAWSAALIRHVIREQFEGMVNEIERRAAAGGRS